ncbi:MAG TPA: hypothetical protein VHP33_39945 [Polyangiaceae bacterium]|nr:hypothetical protein [Polyangiaceae bacterium]
MPQPHGTWRVLGVLIGSSCLATLGCQSPGSQRIVGPDGSPMAHVHCGSEQGVCFRIAGELCPSGYEMKPVLSGSDGNFLVRCRSAGAPAVATQCPAPPHAAAPAVVASRPAPTPSVAAKAPTSKDDWPPTAEPSPPAYPWGEVDLGY